MVATTRIKVVKLKNMKALTCKHRHSAEDCSAMPITPALFTWQNSHSQPSMHCNKNVIIYTGNISRTWSSQGSRFESLKGESGHEGSPLDWSESLGGVCAP